MIETQSTNNFEICIVISIALLNYFLLNMKYCLHKKDMGVNWFFNWGSDYRHFKSIIKSEKDEVLKQKYIGVVFGLKRSAVLFVLVVVAGFLFTKFQLWGFTYPCVFTLTGCIVRLSKFFGLTSFKRFNSSCLYQPPACETLR